MQNDNVKFKILLTLIAILLVGNAFFAIQYMNAQSQLRETQAALTAQKVNERTLAFAKLFIENVLQAGEEVDFDTRLLLENSVRAIGDEEILSQWKLFTQSVSEQDAQQEVKNLLSLLISKVY
jgi:hypothetical protein